MMKQANVVWGRYLPYFASLLVIPISYLSILLLTGQQSLAVCGAALGAVVVYIICKTIQRRGKISLALMIFVLPLLMASGCILFLQLAPFVNHHQRIGLLRTAGITVHVRPPDQEGEWLQSKSGTMLPVWLVKWMGSDCLSEIDSIDGALGAFQSISYAQIDMSRACEVEFFQESINSHVSPELIDWLNKHSNIDRVEFLFSYFSEEDGMALRKLVDKSRVFVRIFRCDLVAELSSLRNLHQLHLYGASLPRKLARDISSLSLTKSLTLEVSQLPIESINELKGYRGYMQIRCRLEPDEITAFARIGLDSLELNLLTSVPTVSVDEFTNMPKTNHLRIFHCQLDVSECKKIAALFQCETLSLYNILPKDSGRDQSTPVTLDNPEPEFLNFSQEVLESFRDLPNLTSVQFFNGGNWETFN
ncbi:MAG: hypothetical protein ACK5OC_05640 [Pirellula sp.]|jgi:hypothetical protein